MGKFLRMLGIFTGIAVLFALVYTGCDMETVEKNAQDPVISALKVTPESPYTEGADLTLTIEASSPDGGTLSYEWYQCSNSAQHTNKGGTKIEGATKSTYQLDNIQKGTYHYYVMVTNTKGSSKKSVQSNLASFGVGGEGDAQLPVITGQPGKITYYYGTGMEIDLSVTASVNDGGTLSYQWYKATEKDSTEGGEKIDGATGSTYTPQITELGSYYFYVVVTNTNPAAVGDKEVSYTSAPITITITSTQDISANATFTIDTNTKYQYVRGFGGMDNPWENVVALNIANYEKLHHPGDPNDPGNTSGENGLGYNIMRIMLFPWDINPDVTMTTLTTDPNGGPKKQYRPDQYEGVKIVNKYGGYVLGSPWSPPAVWKTNNDTIGGNGVKLRTQNYKDFANYLNAYARNFYEHGAPLYAISMQNEPSYADSNYEGCSYTEAEHLAWWREVGHYTHDEGAPKGWGGGKEQPYVLTMSGEAHNGITYLDNVANDSTINGYIDIMGRHIYGAGIDPGSAALKWGSSLRTAREEAGKETWMTEHNLNTRGNEIVDSTWAYVWKFMNEIDLVIRLNKENAFVWWTSKRFYSFLGDDGGLMNNGNTNNGYGTTMDSVLPRGYGLSHYAKFAKEMRQVALTASGSNSGGTALSASNVNPTTYNVDSTAARATAFVSPDGNTISVVMMTPTNTSGSNGQDLGIVKIQLPSNFTIASAVAMRTTATNYQDRNVSNVTELPEAVGTDRHCAYVKLPAGNILSVRFTKQQ
jgi:O-glycosyl hydrolase